MKHVAPELQYVDPRNGRPLTFAALTDRDGGARAGFGVDGLWCGDDGFCWPQIDGIAYLRAGREALASAAAECLQNDGRAHALGMLLCDMDDHAAAAPALAEATAVGLAVNAGQCSALEAMRRLSYGPVADYFAMRPSTPTYLSGLELLAMHVCRQSVVFEVACGVGHFLSHLARHGVACAGCDVTFSKLWLGRRFLLPECVQLVCADLTGGAAFAAGMAGDATVLCHDAFYFLREKPLAAARLQWLAGAGGQTLLGHVHLAGADHGGIAGELCSAADYAGLFTDVRQLYDDLALMQAWVGETAVRAEPADALIGRDALALVAGRASENPPLAALRHERPDELLYRNPLLGADASGVLRARWPSEAFAREYRDADYLGGEVSTGVDSWPRAAGNTETNLQRRRMALPARFVSFAVQPLRWAVIGCGWVARDFVVPAFAHSPSASLVALCDPDAVRRDACRAAAPPAVVHYADHHDMLREQDIDAVYVATPNHRHAGPCIDSASAGCHVLCEKPIAATGEDARRIIDACAVAGVTYATAFDQRFHEAHHVLRESVRQNRLGRITQARIHYACQVDTGWQPSSLERDNWRLDRTRAGGGAVIDLAPHGLDLLAFLLDDEPISVDVLLQPRLTRAMATRTGAEDNRSTRDDVDAGGVLSVRFARGTLASIHVSYQCPEFLPRRELELIGTRAGVRACNTMGQTPGGQIHWREPQGSRTEAFGRAPGLSPFARQIEAFSAGRLRGQRWPHAPERELGHFERLLDAIHRAERIGIDRTAMSVDHLRRDRPTSHPVTSSSEHA